MILIQFICFMLLVLIAILLLIIVFKYRQQYKEYVVALDSKEFPLKVLFPFGFYMLDKNSYSFNSTYDRKILSYAGEIYGQEYSLFYTKAIYSNKIIQIVLFIASELVVGIVSKFDVSFLIYVVLLFGIVFISVDTKLKNKVKSKRLEIQLQFPEFVNKLTLLINAGMTMSKAWEKISSDKQLDAKKAESCFYKELEKTTLEIKAGKNEAEAYSQFAKRAKTPEISRLMSTIIQNTKRGGNDLVLSLRLQSNECWEMRKNAIRRLGEEASTKLLFPMMIMFFAIIIIVVTPALISMQGITSK